MLVFWNNLFLSKPTNSWFSSIKWPSNLFPEKALILPKNDTIPREKLERVVFFHDILSFTKSANDLRGYFVKKYFRSVTFLNYVIFNLQLCFTDLSLNHWNCLLITEYFQNQIQINSTYYKEYLNPKIVCNTFQIPANIMVWTRI